MSQTTFKQNPFLKANPFQKITSYQHSTNNSSNHFQNRPNYTNYQTIAGSYGSKENSFVKNVRNQNELWKFREDNCNKSKPFHQSNNAITHHNYIYEKNDFQKQLVLSNATKKNQKNYTQTNQENKYERIENPFNRRYLINGGKLAQSHVYVGHQLSKAQQDVGSYGRNISQNQNYHYNNNYYWNGDANENQLIQKQSLQNQNTNIPYQNYSRKSIERQEFYNKENSMKLNGIQSRYSLQKDRSDNQVGSYKNLNIPSYKNIYQGISRAQNMEGYSRASKLSRDSRVSRGSRGSIKQQNKQRVKFDSSQSQKQEDNKGKEKQIKINKIQNALFLLQQQKSPLTLKIKGLTFYKQIVEAF